MNSKLQRAVGHSVHVPAWERPSINPKPFRDNDYVDEFHVALKLNPLLPPLGPRHEASSNKNKNEADDKDVETKSETWMVCDLRLTYASLED